VLILSGFSIICTKSRLIGFRESRKKGPTFEEEWALFPSNLVEIMAHLD